MAGRLDGDCLEVQKLLKSWYVYYNKDDFDSLSALYARDAVILPHGHPMVNGPEGAKAVFSGFRKSPGKPCIPKDDAEFHKLGEAIISTGQNVIQYETTGETRKLKDVVVWKKQDGQWKIFRDCFNWDLA